MKENSFMKNSVAFFLGRQFLALSGLLASILFVRYMGVNDYGLLLLGVSIVSFVTSITAVGFELTIPYYLPKFIASKEYGRVKSLLNVIFSARLLTAIIFTSGLYYFSGAIASAYNNPQLEPMLKILSISAFFIYFQNLFLPIFQGIKRLDYDMVHNFFFAILKFLPLLLFFFGGILYAAAGHTISYAVITIAFAVVIFKKLYTNTKSSRIEINAVLRYSIVASLSMILWAFHAQISTILLGFFGTPGVAEFSISYTLSSIMLLISASLITSMLPIVAEKYSMGEMVTDIYYKAVRYSLMFSAPLFIAFVILGKNIISVFYGVNLMYIYNTFIILSAVNFIDSSLKAYQFTAYGIGKAGIDVASSFSKASSNLVFALLFIPNYGAAGAAAALLISTIIGYVVTLLMLNRKIKLEFPFIEGFKYLLASVISILPIVWIMNYVDSVLIYSLYAPLYLLALKAVGAVNEEDKKMFKRIVSRLRI